MKKLVTIAISLLLGIPLLILVVGLLLPRDFDVPREITIQASPQEIFPYINNPSQRKHWSPWYSPDSPNRFTGPEAGPGATMYWQGGKIVITQAEPHTMVEYQTHFDDGYPTSTSRFTLVADTPGVTKVQWDFWGKVPSHPLRRYYILRIDQSTGAKHMKGLQNLKQHIESHGNRK